MLRFFSWRVLRCGARAIRDFHREQVGYWERYYQASGTLAPGDGPLAWVRTLDGHRLAGRPVLSLAETEALVPEVNEGAHPSPARDCRDAPAAPRWRYRLARHTA